MALLSMAEYLMQILHNIFRKKPKENRTLDGLWDSAGAAMDTYRDNIVNGIKMMHPGLSEGQYLDAHGRDLGALTRIPIWITNIPGFLFEDDFDDNKISSQFYAPFNSGKIEEINGILKLSILEGDGTRADLIQTIQFGKQIITHVKISNYLFNNWQAGNFQFAGLVILNNNFEIFFVGIIQDSSIPGPRLGVFSSFADPFELYRTSLPSLPFEIKIIRDGTNCAAYIIQNALPTLLYATDVFSEDLFSAGMINLSQYSGTSFISFDDFYTHIPSTQVAGIEPDPPFQARLGHAFDFWHPVGTKQFFLNYFPLMGASVEIERDPEYPAFGRLIKVNSLPADQIRFYADIYKFRPAHQLFQFNLGPALQLRRWDMTWNLDGSKRFSAMIEKE